ncbi:cache domain-containing sensor histidine kinase [Paenibacillus methanolicus]|uniref:Two-component system sensor histidine kinase YesM n=1 Tax=Paenibacillus methanolicus TaxID=582686 RepID=A0A5S5C5X0_9BACL|nr:sensor histidine kinase [Paenibacillus methanolicus]TYP74831.1 two-component system sensor histidine kinase YesM [Paenibacillus methanolicus]
MGVFYKMSLRQRIWLAFILIVSVVILATGVLAYHIASGVSEQNALRLSQDTLNKTSQALDEKLRNIKTSVFSMMMNMDYRRAVGLEASSDFQNYYTHLSALQSVFVQLRLVEPLIDSILVETPDGQYYENSQIAIPRQSFYATPLYEQVKTLNAEHVELWVGGHQDPFYNDPDEMISFVTEGAMNQVSKNRYVVANVKVSELRKYINRYIGWNQGRFMLLTAGGDPVFAEDGAQFPGFSRDEAVREALLRDAGNFDYSSGGETYSVNYRRLDSAKDWVLFSVLPKSGLLERLGNLKWVILGFMLACLLVSGLIARFLTRLLLRPLTRLQAVIRRVEQSDLTVRFDSPYQDEISQVGSRFNRMLDEINRLFREVKEAETEKRRSELKAMQAQIDPHFLYNTLNTIYWKSQLQEHEHVQHMVLSLSRLFQLGLNKGREQTTLANEIAHVTQYLDIQRQCYASLFDYRIEVDEAVERQRPILKILLQPLVENSILHGFRNRKDGGFIRIGIDVHGDGGLALEVEDNGEGFDAAPPEEGQEPSGYALHNVRKRLGLEYGDEAELRVRSEPGVRTVITMIIPARRDWREAG